MEGGPVEAVTTVSSIVSFMDESFCVSSSTVAVVVAAFSASGSFDALLGFISDPSSTIDGLSDDISE